MEEKDIDVYMEENTTEDVNKTEEIEKTEEEKPAEENVTTEETTPSQQVEPETANILCKYCGAQLPANVRFCTRCGKPLFEQTRTAETPVQQKEKKKTSPKVRIIVSVVAAILVLAGAFAFAIPAIIKNNTYNGALREMREGNYDAAIETLQSLEGYRSSDDYIVYCDALKLVQSGEIESAKKKFRSVSGLHDADRYVSYLEGEIQLGKGYEVEYLEAAKKAFDEAGEFLDSTGMSEYCQGIIAFQNNDASATEILQKVLNDQVVNGMYINNAGSIIRFIDARNKFDNNDFSVLDEFKKLTEEQNDLISPKAQPYVNYIEGTNYYEQEMFYSAYSCFNSCRSLKDAADLADSCFQERPASGIIYKDTSSSVSLTIYDTADGDDAFVKVYDSSDKLLETLYIRDGSSVTAKFQSGKIRLSIAWGSSEEWFGTNEAFGAMGSYRRLLLDGNNEYYNFPSGGSYTLHFNSADGNVGSEYSSYTDF